ncbi:MAG: NUDIX domain-containing protein [Nanohaloarchaea archaeon]|nr:NUDIX domain-containing protein [Candidatus Nanohaloarchaea archaeon]
MVEPLSVALGAVIKEGKVLLVKRESNNFKNLYGFPGGKIEGEEHIRDALKREIEEETGFETSLKRHLGTVSEKIENPESHSPVLLHFFEMKIERKSSESEMETSWFELETISQNENSIIPSGSQMIQEIVKNGKRGYFESNIVKKSKKAYLDRFDKIGKN